jgi:hypothetical protein
VEVINNCGQVHAVCQTVLPGYENMLIPTEVQSSVVIAVPGIDYWASTAAHYVSNIQYPEAQLLTMLPSIIILPALPLMKVAFGETDPSLLAIGLPLCLVPTKMPMTIHLLRLDGIPSGQDRVSPHRPPIGV